MMSFRRVAAASAFAAAIGGAALHSQSDSAARADSIRRADSARANDTSAAADTAIVQGPLRLVASISERKLTVYAGDERVKSYTVAVGTPKYPTPRGTYAVRKIIWNPPWVPPDSPWAKKKTAKGPGEPGNPMKLVKIFFKEPDYYIHGTDDVESLGKAASHGCIRMAPKEASELAQYLMKHGGQPREQSWFARVLSLKWQTRTVNLQRPIQLRIIA